MTRHEGRAAGIELETVLRRWVVRAARAACVALFALAALLLALGSPDHTGTLPDLIPPDEEDDLYDRDDEDLAWGHSWTRPV